MSGTAGRGCQGQGACLHGTHVASLIFAQHGEGPVRGVAPHCRGIVIPVFSDEPNRDGAVVPCSQIDLARAIEAAVGYGARVINISAGQPGSAGTADARLRSAVELCARRGVLIVAAAGNDGCDCLHVPAALPMVVTVGAHDAAGSPVESSNFGGAYQSQGVVAPGVSVLGAAPGGRYERRTGTSFAAPLVAGLAGLLLSARLSRRGYLTVQDAREVHEALLRSAAPCNLDDRRECRRLLAGRVVPIRAFDHYLKGANEMDQLVKDTAPAPATEAMAAAERAEGLTPNTTYESASPAYETTSRAAPVRAGGRTQVKGGAWDDSLGTRPQETSRRTSPALSPSECTSCQQGGGLVFALGELGYDFGTQARYDAINAEMDEGKFPSNPRDLLEFLTVEGGANLHFASAILWTLNHDVAPFYVIRPEGAFARETYNRLLEFFSDQINEQAERVSVPGVLDGTVTLLSGQQVPVLIPELRALYNWKTMSLVRSVVGAEPGDDEGRKRFASKVEGMHSFLERIYFEVRNNGQTPQERALNFAATNAFNLERVFESAASRQLQLDEINVDPSPICRPDSDCWDVRLVFFDPADALGTARTAYRFTVDVSDVVPVLVGPVRSWAVR
ncbi:MAG: PatA/PatG family cyanobactin maturation protease [Bryobacterales bacterium]|nr:PatA/PatG family cyanobactin maturation protease [Bryobacterales bacterium]